MLLSLGAGQGSPAQARVGAEIWWAENPAGLAEHFCVLLLGEPLNSSVGTLVSKPQ